MMLRMVAGLTSRPARRAKVRLADRLAVADVLRDQGVQQVAGAWIKGSHHTA